MVGADDTAVLPDLDDGGEGDVPAVVLVGYIDHRHALYIRSQTRGIHRSTQALNDFVFLLVVCEGEFGGEEGAVEGLLDVLALAAVGGGDAQVVRGGQGGSWDVEGDGFGVGPDSCSFFAVDVLDYFVLDVAEDVVSFLVLCGTDFGSNFDEEGVFLSFVRMDNWVEMSGLTSSPSVDQFLRTLDTSS